MDIFNVNNIALDVALLQLLKLQLIYNFIFTLTFIHLFFNVGMQIKQFLQEVQSLMSTFPYKFHLIVSLRPSTGNSPKGNPLHVTWSSNEKARNLKVARS